MSLDSLVSRVREPRGDPDGAIVLFHGRGADENDLFSLIDVLDPERKLLGISVRGPLDFPMGGYRWFDLDSPNPKQSVLSAVKTVTGWLEAAWESTGISPAATVLAGFSQGAALTHTLILSPGFVRPAAAVAFSGWIPEVAGLEHDFTKVSGFPIAIGHGTDDMVIGVEKARQAREVWESAGANVMYKETPMGHSIDPEFALSLPAWLANAI